jgi:hypothetical protein
VHQRAGCLATLAAIAAAGLWLWLDRRHEAELNSNFDRVSVGMTDRQVVALLGDPKWRGRCGTSNYYSFVEPIKGSADCLVYASSFAPLNPWYPVIFLGRDGRVIAKYTYASP